MRPAQRRGLRALALQVWAALACPCGGCRWASFASSAAEEPISAAELFLHSEHSLAVQVPRARPLKATQPCAGAGGRSHGALCCYRATASRSSPTSTAARSSTPAKESCATTSVTETAGGWVGRGGLPRARSSASKVRPAPRTFSVFTAWLPQGFRSRPSLRGPRQTLTE